MNSELITPTHLANKAIVYVRQSTPHQVLNNQESLNLQYALQQKALELGWNSDNIQLIDADLGLTGSSISNREGFKEIITQVTLGRVGIILSYDVTRLSRNCSDWYPLLDLCGYKKCLIGDRDGIYDPGNINGRLLLGLKGQLAEVELSTIKARLNAGILNKAKRGELALKLPIGLRRNKLNQVEKDPNLEVQNYISMVFKTFLNLKSAKQTYLFFIKHNLKMPSYTFLDELVWKEITLSSILFLLKNPAYAGAFVYGRSKSIQNSADPTDKTIKRKSKNEWAFIVYDKYPEYISWETFEKIQEKLKENYAEYTHLQTKGIERSGLALLHGIVYCGECGHKMRVRYTGYESGNYYVCNYLKQHYRAPSCQYIPIISVDVKVVNLFFDAISPIELDAYSRIINVQNSERLVVEKSQLQQLERLRYQTKLAERQFNQVDPDNRLVAAELEKRWENSLKELKETEEFFQMKKPMNLSIPEDLKKVFLDIGKRLPEIWNKNILSNQQKKSFLRCLIDKVVMSRKSRDIVQTRIVWKGGESTILQIPIPVPCGKHLSSYEAMETEIIQQAKLGKSDQEIHENLTKQGFRSPMDESKLLFNTVKTIRLKHKIYLIKTQSHPRKTDGYLTVKKVSDLINMPKQWIYDCIRSGKIKVNSIKLARYKKRLYLFPDTIDTLEKFEYLKTGAYNNLNFS